MNNSQEINIFFNLALQLIASNLFHFKNKFNYIYKEKIDNVYITKIRQRWIINSGASNNIVWNKKTFDLKFYKTYKVNQSIQVIGKSFFAYIIGYVEITIQTLGVYHYNVILLRVLYYLTFFTNLFFIGSC